MAKKKAEKETLATVSTGAVPKSKVKGTDPDAPVTEKKPKVLIEGITRGRMPIAVVAMVRFGKQSGGKPGDLAALFGTTVGKITDIQKNSTFAYLTEDFRPTKAQKDEGIAWLQRHVNFSKGAVDVLLTELEKTKVASAEEAAALEAVRVKARGQKATTKDGKAANAGGGNRKKAVAAKKPAEPVDAPSADDLLA